MNASDPKSLHWPGRLRTTPPGPYRQRGISIVLMSIALLMLFAFAALAVDGGNIYVAKNELQNASDAGALAGARELYLDDGSMINEGANDVARAAALANYSQGDPVEIVQVRRGHWSFATGTFTENPSTDVVDMAGKDADDLDVDPNFINAVEVITERGATPVEAFFGTIVGLDDYQVQARAVAYLGFAGTINPEELDQPIAICEEALLNASGEYDCSVGRFIPANGDTGGWTNFKQGESPGGASANEIKAEICGDGNPDTLNYGEDIETSNGQVQSVFDALYECWQEATDKTKPWNMTLPVVSCPAGGIGPSNALVGAVNINVMWIVNQDNNQIDNDAPNEMEQPPRDSGGESPGTWSNSSTDGGTRWNDFVDTFNLKQPDGNPAYYDADDRQNDGWRQKTIYFAPDCSYHEPAGETGGPNYGVLAKYPVLVQ